MPLPKEATRASGSRRSLLGELGGDSGEMSNMSSVPERARCFCFNADRLRPRREPDGELDRPLSPFASAANVSLSAGARGVNASPRLAMAAASNLDPLAAPSVDLSRAGSAPSSARMSAADRCLTPAGAETLRASAASGRYGASMAGKAWACAVTTASRKLLSHVSFSATDCHCRRHRALALAGESYVDGPDSTMDMADRPVPDSL
mmetsp:Transcript_12582/g.39752  ORF Transcript_12582/g.39752 Transcript_12582/m.39752 type:complete len:206 (+) Transcript_12582:1158-1775(+)